MSFRDLEIRRPARRPKRDDRDHLIARCGERDLEVKAIEFRLGGAIEAQGSTDVLDAGEELPVRDPELNMYIGKSSPVEVVMIVSVLGAGCPARRHHGARSGHVKGDGTVE
jgi:hypothetical protein